PNKSPNKYELHLASLLKTLFGEEGVPEYRFHPVRRWRFDLAFLDKKIAFEVEGGTWIRGKHTHPIGYQKDCVKFNAAARLGWQVYRLTPSMITEDYLASLFSESCGTDDSF